MLQTEKTAFREELHDIGGVQTHVYVGGNGKPLLWFHGAGGLFSISPLFEALAQDYTVYLVDHPGFGLSDRPKWLKDFDDYNYFYREFLDAFSLDKVTLVGHSLGGRIALEFAISHSHRVEKLILLAPSGLHLKGSKRPDLFLHTPEEIQKLCFYDHSFIELKELSEKEQEINSKNMITLSRLIWWKTFNPKFPRLLKYITAQTCIIWGEKDQWIPVEHGTAYTEYIDKAELNILPECGHNPHIEQQEKCLETIMNFLKK